MYPPYLLYDYFILILFFLLCFWFIFFPLLSMTFSWIFFLLRLERDKYTYMEDQHNFTDFP